MVRLQIITNLTTFVFLCYFYTYITSDQSRDSYNNRLNGLSLRCSSTTNATILFRNNLNLLLSDFTVKSTLKSFYNTSIGDAPDTVYGYYMCRGDITRELCATCIFNAKKFATKSSCEYVDGYFSEEKCIFGYSNHSTYGLLEQNSAFEFDYVETRVSNPKQFNKTLSTTITSLINEASFEINKDVAGFATNEGNVAGDEMIYSMAQCTPDIVGVNCSKCLKSGFSSLISGADDAPGGLIFMNKCQLRYDNVSFYDVQGFRSSKGKDLKPNIMLVFPVLLFFAIKFL